MSEELGRAAKLAAEELTNYRRELDIELADDRACVEFFESNAFAAFDQMFRREIAKFKDILYNDGMPINTPQQNDVANCARLEIAMRTNFLDRFLRSRERYQLTVQKIADLKGNQNLEGK